MARKLAPSSNQPEHDLVFTPLDLAKEIIDHFPLSGKVLDPSKGAGAFYNQFPNTCEKSWAEISEGIDFFSLNDKVDWIITNPPWSKMRAFINHGMELADNVVYLSTINHFTTKARMRDIYGKGYVIKEIYGVKTPPYPWPSSGFQLAAVHLKRETSNVLFLTGTFGQ